MKHLAGKTAAVTGAGAGLGLAHAKLLARSGANVVVNDLGGDWSGQGSDRRAAEQACELITGAGGTASANTDDVASVEGAGGLIKQAVSEHGGLDVLVCNAGILRDSMVFNLDPQDWDAVINVHLRGHYLPVHFAAQHWRERFKATGQPTRASVVLTSSRSGLYANPGQLSYAAAKAGIAAMTVVLARELAKYGVRVNAIAPIARTRMTEGSFGEIGSSRWEPENVSPLVDYLAGDESDGISGQVFVVGGGRVEWMSGWNPRSQIDTGGQALTTEFIARHRDDLFGNAPTGAGGYPTPTWD